MHLSLLSVCLSVRTHNSKTLAPIELTWLFLHKNYYTHGSFVLQDDLDRDPDLDSRMQTRILHHWEIGQHNYAIKVCHDGKRALWWKHYDVTRAREGLSCLIALLSNALCTSTQYQLNRLKVTPIITGCIILWTIPWWFYPTSHWRSLCHRIVHMRYLQSTIKPISNLAILVMNPPEIIQQYLDTDIFGSVLVPSCENNSAILFPT